jgi:lipopolysaccharide biosynthesis glycosyltransferase
MSIDAVYVITQKLDLRLTRICVASIRFWHPDVPIYLIKDEILAEFDTGEIESVWNVKVERCGRARLGGCKWLIKFEPLFLPGSRRILVLDSDIVLCGPLLEALNQIEADFIVAEEYWHGPLTGNPHGDAVVNGLFFDLNRLRTFDSQYAFPGKAFNAGQMVMTTGLLTRHDFDAMIDWAGVPRVKSPEVFRMGDQGIWNYLLHQRCCQGKLTLKYADFMVVGSDSRCRDVDVSRIEKRQGYPFLIHWAAGHPAFLSAMNASDILRFFENYYYSKLPRSGLSRKMRSTTYAAWRVCRQSKYKTHLVCRRVLANLRLLETAKRLNRVRIK